MDFHPVTRERWADLEAVFGEKGAYGGCWCMFWRLERSEYKAQSGEDHKRVMQTLVEANHVPGLIAYVDGVPAAWCAIAPRDDMIALEKSRILKRIDDQPVWSITCFFVAKPYRQHGLMPQLVRAAVDYAAQQGARIIEGYPIDMQSPKLLGQKLNTYAGYMGIAAAFRAVGFEEVGRASETQLIMRFYVEE